MPGSQLTAQSPRCPEGTASRVRRLLGSGGTEGSEGVLSTHSAAAAGRKGTEERAVPGWSAEPRVAAWGQAGRAAQPLVLHEAGPGTVGRGWADSFSKGISKTAAGLLGGPGGGAWQSEPCPRLGEAKMSTVQFLKTVI